MKLNGFVFIMIYEYFNCNMERAHFEIFMRSRVAHLLSPSVTVA